MMTRAQINALADAVMLTLVVAGQGMAFGDLCSETLRSEIVEAFNAEHLRDEEVARHIRAILEAQNDRPDI